MRVKAAISSATLDFGYIQTARQRLEDARRSKTPPPPPPNNPRARESIERTCADIRSFGEQLAEAFWIAIFKAVHCSSKIDFACQRPIALAEYLRHSFANPKTRSLHEIEQRWLFRQLEKALSS